MFYTTLLTQLQKNRHSLFSAKDLLLLNPKEKRKTLLNQLSQWVERGYLLRLRRDLYELADKGSTTLSPIPDLFVANRLCEPSYVSCETALSFFAAIPEVAVHAVSVTTRPSKNFRNHRGLFLYHSCQPEAFRGYRLMKEQGYSVKVAEPEKALVDYVYFKGRESEGWNWEEERLDPFFLKKLNWKKVKQWASLFSKRCQKDLHSLRQWAYAYS